METKFIEIYGKVYENINNIRDEKLVEILENNKFLEKLQKENPNYEEKIIKSIGLSILILLYLEMCN